MFERFTNRKLVDNLIEENEDLDAELNKARLEIEELCKTIRDLQEQDARNASALEALKEAPPITSTEQDSSITFSVDADLSIKILTRVNKEIGEKLVKEGYLDEAGVENETAYHIALLLIANEVTDQMILEYSGELIRDDDETATQKSEDADS